jgi:1-acyl-sn-glycerol-3-phosphate acyltransferase
MGERFYRSVIGGARAALTGLRLDVRTSGAEHIPLEGGAVLAANHIGFLDFVFVGAAAKERGRLVRFMCKKEVFDTAVGGPVMRGMGHIPVDRAAGGASYAQALRALRGGELVGLFPEGTISRSFEPMEFKSGATAMAAAAGVPLLPVAIWGSQRAWTKARRSLAPTERIPVLVAVGEPIPVERRGDHEAATEALRQSVTALVHQLQERYPVAPRRGDDWWQPARLGGSAPTPEEGAALDAERAATKAASRESAEGTQD